MGIRPHQADDQIPVAALIIDTMLQKTKALNQAGTGYMGTGTGTGMGLAVDGNMLFIQIAYRQIRGNAFFYSFLQPGQINIRRFVVKGQNKAVTNVVMLAAGQLLGGMNFSQRSSAVWAIWRIARDLLTCW